ncbi:uncharacterized protein [Chelonus insularis]|uniref:uncharacterized protein n=1 Tax=Chelonus insularis TaxID=460826 RepID=UPI00158DB130|nr:uncharacterized protein LOC118074574 [Chelonus insularis]
MALEMEDGDYLGAYKRFFTDFVENMDPDDQLPVKMTGHEITEDEVVGEIIDMTLQYLNQKYCPTSLQSFIVRLVIEEMKTIFKLQPECCGLKDNIYAPLQLMQAVTKKVNEICHRYMESSRLALLPPPPSSPAPLVSVYAIKNNRRKMEDRYVILHDLNAIFNIENDLPTSYYAVFDGHAGQDAAVYCAAHLHQYLAESVHYPTDLERALRDAFVTTDSYFIQKSKQYSLNSGATAVCAVIFKKKLYIAWAGDSQAALVKGGNVNQLVNPHRPERNDERERVEKMGGVVLYFGMWRVNGDLAVSRAIGDAQYKPYVTSEPEIRCVILDGTEDFLIIACDGLWDCVNETVAAKLVYNQVCRDPHNIEAVSRCLVEHSKNQGSSDNITVIVVFLTPPTKIASRSYAHLQLADVHLDNMDPDNRYLSNANGQYDINAGFVKQSLSQANGSNLNEETSPFVYRKSSNGQDNGIVDYDDEDDEDFGPETDVDVVDDTGESCNLANVSRELFPDKDSRDFAEDEVMNDSPPSPNDNKSHQNELIGDTENVADSEDSDDEWNYYKVDPNKEKDADEKAESKESAVVIDKECTEVSKSFEAFESEKEEQENRKEIDSDSSSDDEKENEKEYLYTNSLINTETSEKYIEEKEQISEPEIVQKEMDFPLNPNAAEFIPVSTPKSLSARIMDLPIAGSPLKPPSMMDDIRLPSPSEFREGASSRPHDLEDKDDITAANGNFLMTDNEEEQSTVSKKKLGFGLDESEVSSTRAEFGDESIASYLTNDLQKVETCDESYSENCSGLENNDPMTMSFGPGRPNPLSQPVDLNAVHELNDYDLCDLNISNQEEDNSATQSLDDHPELVNLISPESETPKHSNAFPNHENIDLLGTSSPVLEQPNHQKFEEKMDDVTSEVAAMNLRNEQLTEERLETKPEPDACTFKNNLQSDDCLLMQVDQQIDESPVLHETSQSESANNIESETQHDSQSNQFCQDFESHEFEHQENLAPNITQERKSPAPEVQVFSNPLDFNTLLNSGKVSADEYKLENEVDNEDEKMNVCEEDENEPINEEFDPPTGDPFTRSLSPSPEKVLEPESKEEEMNVAIEEPEEESVEKSIEEPIDEIVDDGEQISIVHVDSSIKPSKSLQEFTGLEKELDPAENIEEPIKEEIIIIEKEAEKEIIVIEEDPVLKEKEQLQDDPTIEELTDQIAVVEEPIIESQPVNESVVEKSDDSSKLTATVVPTIVTSTAAEKPKSPKLVSKTATKSTTKSTAKSTPTSPTKASCPTSRSTMGQVTKKTSTTTTTNRPKPAESVAKTSTVANKTSAPKPPSKTTTARSTLAPKPKPSLTTKSPSATTEKKPLTTLSNGEAKPAAKAPIKSKISAATTAPKSLVKPSTTARPATAPAAKPKPPTSSTVTKTAVKSAVSSTTGTTTRPKTASSTLTASKPRTLTTTKSPALDKQIKETANKQISSSRTSTASTTKTSRTTTNSTTTMTSMTARRNITTTTKKSPTTNRISAKNTTTAAKTTNKVSSAKVKIQNGVCENKETKMIAEATTTTTTNDDIPKKDSPIEMTTDNQLITAD